MIRISALAIALALVSGAAQAIPVKWIDWQESNSENGFTATGRIEKIGGGFIDVVYNNPQGVAGIQTAGGTDYWIAQGGGRAVERSPYTSEWPGIGVDNLPPDTDIVRLAFAGGQSLAFSETVANLYFAVVSLNGNGYAFVNQDFEVLSHSGANLDGSADGSDRAGFWGSGSLTKNVVANFPDTDYQLIGSGEPHGVIRFSGAFDSVEWRSLTSEDWNGFTIGVEGEASVVLPPPPPSGEVPLPPTLALLGLAMAGLGLQLHRRRPA